MIRRVIVASLLAAGSLTGCEMERRVLKVHGPLVGLPGAVGGEQTQAPLVPRDATPISAGYDPINNPANYATTGEVDAGLRIRQPDGSARLVSRNPRELLLHLRTTLMNEEYSLLVEQLLSDRTIDEYRRRGLSVTAAEAFFRRHREDVLRLIGEFPMGELTPDRNARPIGLNLYRLEVPPEFAEGGGPGTSMVFRRLEYSFDATACRLVMID